MQFDGIPIHYLNLSLISFAKNYGLSEMEDILVSTNYGLIVRDNSFANIIKDINTLTQTMHPGGYAEKSYKQLFGKACEVIASRTNTNLNAYAIAEIVRQKALETYEIDLRIHEEKIKNKVKREYQQKKFLRKIDEKMAELVRELRITFSKSYKPFMTISLIAGLGSVSWFGTQYWIKEKSAQGELANVHSQNLMLTTENKELTRYKDAKSQIQNMTQEIELLKEDNNKIKTENKSLKQETTRISNENQNLRNRIERCNSGFIRLRKC